MQIAGSPWLARVQQFLQSPGPLSANSSPTHAAQQLEQPEWQPQVMIPCLGAAVSPQMPAMVSIYIQLLRHSMLLLHALAHSCASDGATHVAEASSHQISMTSCQRMLQEASSECPMTIQAAGLLGRPEGSPLSSFPTAHSSPSHSVAPSPIVPSRASYRSPRLSGMDPAAKQQPHGPASMGSALVSHSPAAYAPPSFAAAASPPQHSMRFAACQSPLHRSPASSAQQSPAKGAGDAQGFGQLLMPPISFHPSPLRQATPAAGSGALSPGGAQGSTPAHSMPTLSPPFAQPLLGMSGSSKAPWAAGSTLAPFEGSAAQQSPALSLSGIGSTPAVQSIKEICGAPFPMQPQLEVPESAVMPGSLGTFGSPFPGSTPAAETIRALEAAEGKEWQAGAALGNAGSPAPGSTPAVSTIKALQRDHSSSKSVSILASGCSETAESSQHSIAGTLDPLQSSAYEYQIPATL